MAKRIVIIGNGMVGYKFCEKFVAKEQASDYQIIVFGEEARPAYDRVHLSEYFESASEERLLLATADWYKENDIILNQGELVIEIDRAQKQVKTHKGNTCAYDYLILATGSYPFVPPIEGV
ncbi:MAG: FAD-dependent oxidoreductase, partial [Bacteroidota bacterium]